MNIFSDMESSGEIYTERVSLQQYSFPKVFYSIWRLTLDKDIQKFF